jgi:hypothetical protein
MGGPQQDWSAVLDWGLDLPGWVLPIAPAWPLAMAVLLALAPLRSTALRLTPWAALPALLLAVAGPAGPQPLPGLLLGGTLLLDQPGRLLLGAVALLWLVSGWLAAGRLRTPREALALLLALAGAIWLPLAGDLPSLLAASVLAAYPLYALLGGARAAPVLLASVVIADLLLLEALLLLAKGADGLELAALRTALEQAPEPGLILTLLLLGFGLKAGAMGLHYWLPAALAAAADWLLPAVMAFMLAAGLLPGLHLLPVGQVQWPAAAAVLQVLAVAGGIWAVVAGLPQPSPRAMAAYLASALVMAWLLLLALFLDGPVAGAHAGAASAMLATALAMPAALGALGVGALLLSSLSAAPPVRPALLLLSVLLLVLAILGGIALVPASAAGTGVERWALLLTGACAALLLGGSLGALARNRPATEHPSDLRIGAALGAATALLATVGLLALALLLPWLAGDWQGALDTLAGIVAGVAAGLLISPALAVLRRMPPGDLLTALEWLVAGGLVAWQSLGVMVADGRRALQRGLRQLGEVLLRPDTLDRGEALLRRWPTAMLLLLVTGSAVALLAQRG